MKEKCLLKNEDGSVLILALVMLVLLTLLGIAATTTSIIEVQIANNDRLHKTAFYTAEAGIENLRAIFNGLLVDRNSARIAASQSPIWTFALDGTEAGVLAATGTNYAGGAVWIQNGSLGGYSFTVTVWNKPDAGDATNDSDGLIFVRSDASGPRGATSSIEVLLRCQATGEAITGYTAQAGAGAGKSYNAQDLDAITDFTSRL